MYNNQMYALAGIVAERLAGGKPWHQLIRQYVFEPLNMTSSTFVSELSTLEPSEIAHAFGLDNGTHVQLDMESLK